MPGECSLQVQHIVHPGLFFRSIGGMMLLRSLYIPSVSATSFRPNQSSAAALVEGILLKQDRLPCACAPAEMVTDTFRSSCAQREVNFIFGLLVVAPGFGCLFGEVAWKCRVLWCGGCWHLRWQHKLLFLFRRACLLAGLRAIACRQKHELT
mmetsp:Transcript_177517/g.569329  ORF Transcript_177517/g.569329 Transcript_177517/m.569329 type:complete len:152 (-) Transcript_177517:565-1020(-)